MADTTITKLKQNMDAVDDLVNSNVATVTTPDGRVDKTFYQIQQDADSAIANTGWFPVSGSFEDGGTITERNQVLLLQNADGSNGAGYYSWGGALPKTVAAASTPSTTGGIGETAWVYRADATVRSDAANGTLDLSGRTAQRIVDGLEYQGIDDPLASNLVDVFLCYGQSNAVGTNTDPLDAPAVPTNYGFMSKQTDGTIETIAEPTGIATGSGASAWSAFALEWVRLTGRRAVILNYAQGGTLISELVKGQPRYDNVVLPYTTNVFSKLSAGGYAVNSFQMLFVQGEADAKAGTTANDYKTLLEQLNTDLTNDFPQYQGMYVSKVGYDLQSAVTADYQGSKTIGYAQLLSCKNISNINFGFVKAPTFNRINVLMGSDGLHYSMQGYNLMGEEFARNVHEQKEAETANGRLIQESIINEMIRGNNWSGLSDDREEIPFPISLLTDNLINQMMWMDNNSVQLRNGKILYGDKDEAGSLPAFELDVANGTFRIFNKSGNFSIQSFPGGAVQFQANNGAGLETTMSIGVDGVVKFQKLPSSASGISGGGIYYDAADGNTVKYAP